MLDLVSRGTILSLSALCVVAAVAFAPGRAGGSVGMPVPQPVASSPLDGPRPPEAIRRDPFAEPTAPPAAAPAPALPPAPRENAGPLPANLSSDAIPAVPGDASDAGSAAVSITAVVSGAHPYALVQTNGVNEIKGLGDRVDGIPIEAIGIDGVRLRNGRNLTVDAADRR